MAPRHPGDDVADDGRERGHRLEQVVGRCAEVGPPPDAREPVGVFWYPAGGASARRAPVLLGGGAHAPPAPAPST